MRVKTEERRLHILEVASQVFLEMGFERTSMAEISTRVGGSKATLYSYFPSKEALFVATTLMHGQRHADEAFATLKPQVGDLAQSLQSYGERILALLCRADIISAIRMVIAESGKSDVGRLFFTSGPQHCHQALSQFLALESQAGRLKGADPDVMSTQFAGLLESQTLMPLLFGVRQNIPKAEIKRIAAAAVNVFLMAYGTDRSETTKLALDRRALGDA